MYNNLSKVEADIIEIQLIKKYKATNPDYGYNIATGGSSRSKYYNEEERQLAHKKIQHKAYKKMISNELYAKKMREKALEVYYANKSNAVYLEARRKSNYISRQNVKQVRDKLRYYYSIAENLFTTEEVEMAFGFAANKKSYKCNSIKKLNELLEIIIKRYKNE